MGLFLFLLCIPLLTKDPYHHHILITTMFHIILAMGLNFVMNTAQVPLCQAGTCIPDQSVILDGNSA